MTGLENGFMNDSQIKKAKNAKELVIYPYNSNNLTPVGYNLSFSRFIVSLRRESFVKLHKDKENGEWYFYIKPHETVLILTREAIWVSRFIGGTFQSKVSLVADGLGHASTTLDPGWQGQLLVPINNLTQKRIKIPIAHEKESGDLEYYTFVTMVLFYTNEAACTISNNKSARIEILEKVLTKKHRKIDKEISGVLTDIKKVIGYPELNDDLNDPSDRVKKVQNFESQYRELTQIMDNAFNTVNKISRKENKRCIVSFWTIFIAVMLIMIVIAYGIYCAFGKEHDEMVNVFISILIPFSMLLLNHLKERLL